MVWTGSALELYLYGYEYGWYREVDGRLAVLPEAIGKHQDGTKQIPSGFFEQPDTEHVGAVLFSNSATVSKFNRMGFLKGYRPKRLFLLRVGSCYNHEPHATEPLMFRYIIGSRTAPEETWAEGLSMFHNPKALVPVPEDMFPGIAHHRLDELHRMRSVIPAFHPFASFTHVLNGIPDSTACPPVSPAFVQMLQGEPPVGGPVETPRKPPAGVRRISRAEVRSHRLAESPVLAPAMEKSWFADDKDRMGTVFLDVWDRDWNFVVLAPDGEGIYHWIAGDGGMDTQDEAERALTMAMSEL